MSRPRKLAAILAADIVGYSRLTDEDEDRTLARLRALRSDLLDPTVDVHGGRVVKRIGDEIIVEFRSVVDAVRSALEIQNSMTERNAGLPQERRIEFRIGIHVGDVVEEFDGDLMGEGVNIAARLEGVAKAGLIYLSEDAYRQVRSRLDVAVNDLGPIKLKNISFPVRTYALQVGGVTDRKPAASTPDASRVFKLSIGAWRWHIGIALAALAAVAVITAIAYAWRSNSLSRPGQQGGSDATDASFAIIPAHTLAAGAEVTVTTPDGRRLTCVGGDGAKIPRRCKWE